MLPQAPFQDFITSCQALKGDEKGEAQTFLNRFFQAFGYADAIAAGATFEERVSRGSAAGKTGFADLVWKPRVLIEMKKRGTDLSKHYAQALQYWTNLVPNRPRYVLLCNFDQFWIYDFNVQVDTPVDVVELEQLPSRISAFAFMEVGHRTPVFRNNQVEITEKAARRMGELYQCLKVRAKNGSFSEAQAQRFILQCVLAMFAEDRGLLPTAMFIECVQDCVNGGSTYDILGGLFREMNTPGQTPAGRYQGVDYFNGGLFAQVQPLELEKSELRLLEVAAREDWGKVRPAIFGNIFEKSADDVERHARGMHFTSEVDIMKIIRPTISRFWESQIEAANTIKELNQLQLQLQQYRVLDPACGSGNFLYLAYQELKRIEVMLLDKIAAKRRAPMTQGISFVTPNQFYGLDTNPFAVELARVTLMIGRKIAIDKHHLTESALPLDTLDQNIVCADALFTPWPKADAIIGNPPFLGGSRIRLELGDDYAEKVFTRFSDIRAQVDFASYWIRLAHENMDENGRAGLVATNSISQGKSRSVSLDYIVNNGGYIHDAISSQPWSGEAAVYVSIVNWSKRVSEICSLDNFLVNKINSSLSCLSDVTQAKRLSANLNKAFVGMQPNGKGFYITEEQAKVWIKNDTKNNNVLKPSIGAKPLTDNVNYNPDRWIIDFADLSIEDASIYTLPLDYVRKYVKPERDVNRELILREKWWRFKRTNQALRNALFSVKFYFIVPRHSKWFIFVVADKEWLPADSTTVVASDDFYVLGILTSKLHRAWVKAQSSTLEDRTRYTHNTCFETFPFPQTATPAQIQAIRSTMQQLHDYRTTQMEQKQWGITKLYNAYFDEPASQLYQLHAQLNQQVLAAYGFNPNDDLLAKLLALNLECAAKESKGEPIKGPTA